MINQYWKAITSLVIGVLGWVGTVVASDAGPVTNEEWSLLIATLIATIGVFLVPNAPKPIPPPPEV